MHCGFAIAPLKIHNVNGRSSALAFHIFAIVNGFTVLYSELSFEKLYQ